jgi:hypothetical protein
VLAPARARQPTSSAHLTSSPLSINISSPHWLQVYSVTTNSNNNTWLRRKLLEAVGASRRFYNAASKAGGRPKARRAPAAPSAAPAATVAAPAEGSHAAAAAFAVKGPTHYVIHQMPAQLQLHHHQQAHQQPHQQQHSGSSSASLHNTQPHQPHHHHLAAAPGPALPAGSPRALVQRMRAAQQQHHPAAAAHHYLAEPQRHFFQPLHQQQSSEEEEGGDTCSEEAGAAEAQHPRALAPHHGHSSPDCSSPTSVFAATAAVTAAGHKQLQQLGFAGYFAGSG